jgi:hypothetical protein
MKDVTSRVALTAQYPELSNLEQLDRIVNPSISDRPSLLYNGRLPEEDLCPNQMTVERATLCNAIYGLFSWNAEDTNIEDKANMSI